MKKTVFDHAKHGSARALPLPDRSEAARPALQHSVLVKLLGGIMAAWCLGAATPALAVPVECPNGTAITADTTCTLPANTTITVEAWGGGGGGGSGADGTAYSGNRNAGSGGGGGSYCNATIDVGGSALGVDVVVGAGGTAGDGNPSGAPDGGNGGESSVKDSTTGTAVVIIAAGGAGGSADTYSTVDFNGTGVAGGAGGGACGSVTGATLAGGFAGGNGGASTGEVVSGAGAPGGGGAGASELANGNAGNNSGNQTAGGAGETTNGVGEGSGGNGAGCDPGDPTCSTPSSDDAQDGIAPGGGGGGGGYSNLLQSFRAGGGGAAGAVMFSWSGGGGGGDTTPPDTPTLTINGDAPSTSSLNVTVEITGDTDDTAVTGWYLSETNSAPAAGDGGWVGTRPTSATLSGGDGTKTLYVWTKDAAGNVSDAGSDSIVYAAAVPVAGACGSSHGTSRTSAPTTNLCTAGTAGGVSGSGPWSWSCSGENGGTTASCSASLYTPPPVNGACGTSNGGLYQSAPTTNLCGSGSTSGVTGDGPWAWSCRGSNGGTTASCSANIAPINGACGASHGGTFDDAPSEGLCATGSAGGITGDGPWSWSCQGAHGGTTASCSATLPPVNGVCGTTHGTTSPPADLSQLQACASGDAVAAQGGDSGPWSWQCRGTNGGTTASCSADWHVDGQCGSSHGQAFTAAPGTALCSTGEPSTVSGEGPWRWSCAGNEYGGAAASCIAAVRKQGTIPANGSFMLNGSVYTGYRIVSQDEQVAAIDPLSNGVRVRGVAAGTTTVTASTPSGTLVAALDLTVTAADTTAPTAEMGLLKPADTTVEVTVSDNGGTANIDFDGIQGTSVRVNGREVTTTSTVDAGTVRFTLPQALATGSTVEVSFSIADRVGNRAELNLRGTVVEATTTSATPVVWSGASGAQTDRPTLTIRENYADALSEGFFRIILPSGFSFVESGTTFGGVAQRATLSTTFGTNDTLKVEVAPTAAVDEITIQPALSIARGAENGVVQAIVLDGDLTGSNGTKMAGSTERIGYLGEWPTLTLPASASVTERHTTTLTPSSGTAVSYASSDTAVATVTDGGVVTGVAAGTATITATDALGREATTAVTVRARGEDKPLGAASALGNAIDARITGGVSNDGGATIEASGTFAATDSLDVFATIYVDSDDVGTAGDIIVVTSIDGSWFTKTANNSWEPWDGTPGTVRSARSVSAFSAAESVDVVTGLTGLTGSFNMFVGYQNGSGDIIYNSTQITFTVE